MCNIFLNILSIEPIFPSYKPNFSSNDDDLCLQQKFWGSEFRS